MVETNYDKIRQKQHSCIVANDELLRLNACHVPRTVTWNSTHTAQIKSRCFYRLLSHFILPQYLTPNAGHLPFGVKARQRQ